MTPRTNEGRFQGRLRSIPALPEAQIERGYKIGEGSDGQGFRGSWRGRQVVVKTGAELGNEAHALLSMPACPHVAELLAVLVRHRHAAGRVRTKDVVGLLFEAGDCDLHTQLCEEPLTEAQTWRLAHTLAGAVHVGAEHGVVHGDLKPGNVVVFGRGDDDMTFKVIDYGSARRLGKACQPPGTPRYLPPEATKALADRKPLEVQPAGDLWAAGVIVMTALLGVENRPDKPYHEHRPGDLPACTEELNVRGRDLLKVVQSCFHPDPALRWRTGTFMRFTAPLQQCPTPPHPYHPAMRNASRPVWSAPLAPTNSSRTSQVDTAARATYPLTYYQQGAQAPTFRTTQPARVNVPHPMPSEPLAPTNPSRISQVDEVAARDAHHCNYNLKATQAPTFRTTQPGRANLPRPVPSEPLAPTNSTLHR